MESSTFAGTLNRPISSLSAGRTAGIAVGAGNPGDARPVGEGVSELRIDYGPGYRVYFQKQAREIVILLAGGDKRTQSDDVKTALRLARNL